MGANADPVALALGAPAGQLGGQACFAPAGGNVLAGRLHRGQVGEGGVAILLVLVLVLARRRGCRASVGALGRE